MSELDIGRVSLDSENVKVTKGVLDLALKFVQFSVLTGQSADAIWGELDFEMSVDLYGNKVVTPTRESYGVLDRILNDPEVAQQAERRLAALVAENGVVLTEDDETPEDEVEGASSAQGGE